MRKTIRAGILVSLACCLCSSWVSAQTFRFVAWGDSRGTSKGVDTAVFSPLSDQAAAYSPKFTLFSGDLCAKFARTCPSAWTTAINGKSGNGMFNITFVTRGNHDVGNKKINALWQSYFDMEGTVSDLSATNFSQMTEDETYSFDYGNSHFVSVDVPGDVNIITPTEITWLDSDIAAAEARGQVNTFIFWHGPIYCVDGHCNYTTTSGSDAPAALVDVLNKHATIKATFHGHEHVNTHTHIDSTRIPGLTHEFEQFVLGSAGAPPYTCDNTARFDFCNPTPGFGVLDVSGSSITINVYLQNQTTAAYTLTFY